VREPWRAEARGADVEAIGVSDGPRILASDGKWRIVRAEAGEKVTYTLERHDGCDALGVERWKELRVGEADNLTRQLRDYIIATAVKAAKESDSAENL
jgi:hypothetical protein